MIAENKLVMTVALQNDICPHGEHNLKAIAITINKMITSTVHACINI